ncbi:MAG: nuclear transport factor 2 family protein [Erythrobacter sp.]|uniref:nuclear transport factor 2 family protein n=1 Tax=Erythrobacter sp. TaxID=1042 RepID=UPI0032679D45
MDNITLCRRFFSALEANDLAAARKLCARSFEGSQNGGPSMNVDTLMQFTGAVHLIVPDFHYENTNCTANDAGFVEEHDVCGTLPNGETFKLVVCVVAQVSDGKITALREYVDTGAAAGLLKALRPT